MGRNPTPSGWDPELFDTQPSPGNNKEVLAVPGRPEPPTHPPRSYLLTAVLVTFLLNPIIGPVGWYYSTKVPHYWSKGQFSHAHEASRKARNTVAIAATTGLAMIISTGLLLITLEVTGVSTFPSQ